MRRWGHEAWRATLRRRIFCDKRIEGYKALKVEGHEALRANLRWRPLCGEHYHALKVGMRRPDNAFVSYLARELGNCDIQNRGCALLKPSTEGMRWLDYYIETKWSLSRWYIYKWTENSIVLITFQSSSWFHFEAKQRREVEEGVHVDLEWNSRRFRGGNLSWSGGLSWCYLIKSNVQFWGKNELRKRWLEPKFWG